MLFRFAVHPLDEPTSEFGHVGNQPGPDRHFFVIGAEMVDAANELQEGRLTTTPQWEVPDSKLCLRRDYHPWQVVELYKRIEGGLFRDYPARQHRVEKAIRLID